MRGKENCRSEHDGSGFAGGAAELALRSTLFGNGLLAAKLGDRLRRAGLYADGRFDEASASARRLDADNVVVTVTVVFTRATSPIRKGSGRWRRPPCRR